MSPKTPENWVRFDLYDLDHDALRRDLWGQVSPVLRGRCEYLPNGDIDVLRVELVRACLLIGDDLEARYERACIARPVPKAWSGLNEDGTTKKKAGTRNVTVKSGKKK